MKYYLIAGEASGDLHASNLMKALTTLDAEAEYRAWGGDQMAAAGGALVKHFRELAFMGFSEVAANLRTILRNIDFCKKDIEEWQPDALILIDYPGFNMRIAKWAKKKGLKIYYYISPQIWAWNTRRVHELGKNVDRVLVILPFEKAFFAEHDYEVSFVGHPLLDVTENYQPKKHFSKEKPIIALLPGSRRQEISRMLDGMLEVIPAFPDHQFYIAGAPAIEADFYQKIIDRAGLKTQPQLVFDQTYDLLAQADSALVASGTATLETALFGVPQVVCYRGSWINYWLFRLLIKVKFISLVNLIVDRKIVEELIQADFRKEKLVAALAKIQQPEPRQQLQMDYQELRQKLGNPGASARAAEVIFQDLNRIS